MKNIHSKLSSIAPYIFLPVLLLIKMKRKAVYICLAFFVLTLSSCFLSFYRTNTKPSIDATTVSNLNTQNKYFIIHFPGKTNGLENVYVNNDSLYGQLIPVPPEHEKYMKPKASSSANRVKSKDKKDALTEVHLYTSATQNTTGSALAISLSSINRVDVYELNKGATTTNHVLSVVGIVAGSVLVIGAIAFAISCNCPQVYVDNNFVSGMYSGAVYSTLERKDYLPLNTIPYNANDISFRIANAKNEEQFINEVNLLQVEHAASTNVLADRHGKVLSYQQPQLPISALTNEKNDVKTLLQQTDDQYYSFNNNANSDGFSDVNLVFNKPANTDNAKLIIHARNTMWGGLIHKEFINLFGDDFEKWRAKQEKADPKELEKWQTDQALPLMVYIKTNKGWKFIDYYQLIGNTASRDMIMQVDTKEISGDKIELKLETAYRFWDLDFAGIDYSNDEQLSTVMIEPSAILKSDSTDEKQSLQTTDQQYVHLVNDEYISCKYSIPTAPANNMQRSYFIVSGGYYHNLEPVTGKADYNTLLQFKKPGAFDKFSREKYKQAEDVAAVIRGTK